MAGYTTTAKVRERTGLSTSEVGDTELDTLILDASLEINNQLNVKVFNEKVTNLGGWKTNYIDSSNATYYTREYPLGDKGDDFTVGTADVYCYSVYGSTKTVYSVSAIDDDEEGKFTLTTAPAVGVVLYVTYEYLPISITDAMIAKVCTELSAFYAVKRIHGRGIKEYRLGALTIKKGDSVGKEFFDEYDRTLNQIRRKKLWRVLGDDLLKIPFNGE